MKRFFVNIFRRNREPVGGFLKEVDTDVSRIIEGESSKCYFKQIKVVGRHVFVGLEGTKYSNSLSDIVKRYELEKCKVKFLSDKKNKKVKYIEHVWFEKLDPRVMYSLCYISLHGKVVHVTKDFAMVDELLEKVYTN